MPLLRRILDRLRRAPLVTRALFGVRIRAGTPQAHWDFVTLALRRALRDELRPGQGVVEVGTGECAILATWLARHHDGPVLALDVSEEAIAAARQAVAANQVPVELRQSDLLEAVRPSDAAELVLFNPPFVPTRSGEAAMLPQREPRRVWDGGPDGLAVIRRFLEQCVRLPPTTTVLLGFNARVVSTSAVRQLAQAAGLELVRERTGLLSPAVVLVLRPRGKT